MLLTSKDTISQNKMYDLDQKAETLREKARMRYDASSRPLTVLKVGMTVDVQHHVTKRWDTTAKVVKIGPHRDYTLRLESGRIIRRNRRYLRHHTPSIPYRATRPAPPTCDTRTLQNTVSQSSQNDTSYTREYVSDTALPARDEPSAAAQTPMKATLIPMPALARKSTRKRRVPKRLQLHPSLGRYPEEGDEME